MFQYSPEQIRGIFGSFRPNGQSWYLLKKMFQCSSIYAGPIYFFFFFKNPLEHWNVGTKKTQKVPGTLEHWNIMLFTY